MNKIIERINTQPSEPRERCEHEHLCCPGDIKTVRCAYCGKSMYQEPEDVSRGELSEIIDESLPIGCPTLEKDVYALADHLLAKFEIKVK